METVLARALKGGWVAAIALYLVSLAALSVGCSGEASGESNVGEERRATAQAERKLRVVRAEAVEHRDSWEVRGVLEPIRVAGAAFIVGGRLTKVMVERGERVEEGQVLARLDAAEVGAGVAQARSAVSAAEAQVELAEDAVGRLERLTEEGAVGRAELVKARLQRDSALAMKARAQAALQMVQVKGGQHQLRSPISGTVLDVPDRVGEIIGPGIPQFEIADLSKLRFRGSLPEDASDQIRLGQPVKIQRRGGQTLTGEITFISPALAADTHRLPFEAEADPPGDGAQGVANSFVRVTVEAPEVREVAKIPATALVRGEEITVFVVESGAAKQREVSVVQTLGEHTLVSGIDPTAEVINLPPVDLEDGAPVER